MWMMQTSSELIMAPPTLLSAGSDDLLKCIPCCFFFHFSSNSSHFRLYFLHRPSAPSPPATHAPSHAFLTPPTPAPPAAGQVPSAPFHAAAAPASHPPIQRSASPSQSSTSWSHEPLWQPWGFGTRLCSAALWPGCQPIWVILIIFPPFVNDREEMLGLYVNIIYLTAREQSAGACGKPQALWSAFLNWKHWNYFYLLSFIHLMSTSLTAEFCLKTDFVFWLLNNWSHMISWNYNVILI